MRVRYIDKVSQSSQSNRRNQIMKKTTIIQDRGRQANMKLQLFKTRTALMIYPAQPPPCAWVALSLQRRILRFFADVSCPRDPTRSGKCSSPQGNQAFGRQACPAIAVGTEASRQVKGPALARRAWVEDSKTSSRPCYWQTRDSWSGLGQKLLR